ncbi:hypothetical protein [Vibrio europaeus]|uniref:hypothetical protein n=1 Tax=Vibrio europaeus TaxID=300876 RepID=UPI00233F6BBA|nr:hypothetical protein [Vibrio europaeus]MDC5753611.1 hypothetical protein [Vibrio europaeus]MDC5816476.1 hypothetical protein [Vibrio europaeus]
MSASVAALKALGVVANVVETVIQVTKQRSAEDLSERRKLAKTDPVGYFRQFSRRVRSAESSTSEANDGMRGDRTGTK